MADFTRLLLFPALLATTLLGACSTPDAHPAAAATPKPIRSFAAADKSWEREPPFGARRNNSVEY